MIYPVRKPGIYAGDVINRKHQLFVKAGSKPHLSNGVNFEERRRSCLIFF